MITVIAHFHNEEKFLPWWLAHHRNMFDHGILIDHDSTDNSVAICREMAPNWQVVKTGLENFDAIENDFEVMNYEKTVTGWKMALNVTEFLVAPDFKQRMADYQTNDVMSVKTRGVIMVDKYPDIAPDLTQPLLAQKYHGYVEEGWRLSVVEGKKTRMTFRHRMLHRYPQGAYYPGRHKSWRPIGAKPDDMFTLWFGYSPWTEWYVSRKRQFVKRIPKEDVEHKRGDHMRTKDELEKAYLRRRMVSYDLTSRIPYIGPGYKQPE